jgi:ribonuclease HI
VNNLPKVEIYGDGACSGNPGPGGWAAVILADGHRQELSGGEKETTNNRMEIMAALNALRALRQPAQVTFYTDSSYLLNGATVWLPEWKRQNWKRKKGKLANIDLWQELDRELSRHTVRWVWVRGHAGNRLNEYVDQLAKAAIPPK